MIYVDDTGAITSNPESGFYPVLEGNKPIPGPCQVVVKDKLVKEGDHWVQIYKLTSAPMYSAGDWLETVEFGAGQQPTLIYMKLQLYAAGKSSPKLIATEEFMNSVLSLYASAPIARCDWDNPPYTFQEVVFECVQTLQN